MDQTITKYNLNHADAYDMNYLITLSDRNAIQLKHYSQNNKLESGLYNRIDRKYANYLNRIEGSSWQEKTYADYTITEVDKSL